MEADWKGGAIRLIFKVITIKTRKETFMTLKFLDLYNTAASQEWSMYDNDATNTNDMEQSLIIDLNKAVTEILYSHPFPFRERTHVIFTMPNIKSYNMPEGIIMKNKRGVYNIKINSRALNLIEEPFSLEERTGIPEGFYIRGSKLILYPTPNEKFIVTIDYLTLAIAENSEGEDIFELSKDNDIITIPEHLETIFKNAVISRTMLNSISAEGDENYSAYKKQSEMAYKQLVKYSKGVGPDKVVKI